MLTQVRAGPFTVRGVSLAGVYTSLQIPELRLVFDVGLAPRSFAGCEQLFLSHAHADHIGAIVTFLGNRTLFKSSHALRMFVPAEIAPEITELIAVASRLQRRPFSVEVVPMQPEQALQLSEQLWVRAFRTFHPVPSLGYEFFRRIAKLRPEYRKLPAAEIARLRAESAAIFDTVQQSQIAYATDTLIDVLRHTPELLQTRVLILECTYLDERKSIEQARQYCHIHLDEIVTMADSFHNEQLVLMHFSQHYRPQQVLKLLDQRCPPQLRQRIVPFVPASGDWPG